MKLQNANVELVACAMKSVAVDRSRRAPVALLAVVAGVWISAASLGLSVLWAYGVTPGEAARASVAATRPADAARDGEPSSSGRSVPALGRPLR